MTPGGSAFLREDVVNHLAVDVSGPIIATAVVIRQLFVVQPQLVTEGGNHVRNTDSIDDALVPKIIRFTIDQAWLETASGEPEGERISVVVAARPVLCGWQAAKFAGPDDQGLIEQAPLFQVHY